MSCCCGIMVGMTDNWSSAVNASDFRRNWQGRRGGVVALYVRK